MHTPEEVGIPEPQTRRLLPVIPAIPTEHIREPEPQFAEESQIGSDYAEADPAMYEVRSFLIFLSISTIKYIGYE